MELFDSHAHYDDEKFDEDRENIIKQLYTLGVTRIISAGYNYKSSEIGLELAKKYSQIYTTSGISPNDIGESKEDTDKLINKIDTLVKVEMETNNKTNLKSKIVGIGEIGLDFHWNKENIELQEYAFIRQIELANKYNLPIAIHSREAVNDTIDILKNKMTVNKKGVFHCCPLNRELVKEALKLEFYISLAGTITFKNSKNAEEIVKMIPLDKLLIETDCPYLSPEPVRGTRNDSRNLKYIAEKIAIIKGISAEEVAKITYENTNKLYNI